MARPFLTSIDLGQNQILNASLQNLAAAPSSPVPGQVYYNTANAQPYCWNSSAWLSLSAAGSYLSLTGGTLSGLLTAPAYRASGAWGAYEWYDGAAGADAKYSDITQVGGVIYGRLVNDAYSTASNWLSITRTGYVANALNLYASTIGLNAAVNVSGNLAVGGGAVTVGTTGSYNVASYSGLTVGYFNPGTQAGDNGIIYTAGSAGTGALIIAPWSATAGASLRMTAAGASTLTGSLSIGGTVSGAGVTALFAAPPPIGSTTPNSAAFNAVTTAGLTAYGLLAIANNSSSLPPATSAGALNWNFTGGAGETDFFNLYSSATTSFQWYQRGASSATLLAGLSSTGTMALTGGLSATTGSFSGAVSSGFLSCQGGSIGGTGWWFGSNATYASGWKYIATDFAWFMRSDGSTSDVVSLYVGPSGTAGATLTAVNSLTVNQTGGVTIPITLTVNGNATLSGGATTLNNATSNWLNFGTNGNANPTLPSRSAGTKIVLRDVLNGVFEADFAIGVGPYNLWHTVPDVSCSYNWYQSATNIMGLDGSGNLTVTGAVAAASIDNVPIGQTTRAAGGFAALNAASGNLLTNIGRNRVDNGDMEVAQRPLPVTASGTYVVDRWIVYFLAGTASVTQSSTANYTSRKQISGVFTGLTATNICGYVQRIEAARSWDLAGQNVTVSFNSAYTVSAGSTSFAVELSYATVTDNFASRTVIGTATAFTPSSTPGTYSATFAVPSGATTGLEINFIATQATATGNLTWLLTSVQLEAGSIATQFERVDPVLSLHRCQRFYQSFTNLIVLGYSSTGSQILSDFLLPVQMRATPTATITSAIYSNASAFTANSLAQQHVRLQSLITAGPAIGYGQANVALIADL